MKTRLISDAPHFLAPDLISGGGRTFLPADVARFRDRKRDLEEERSEGMIKKRIDVEKKVMYNNMREEYFDYNHIKLNFSMGQYVLFNLFIIIYRLTIQILLISLLSQNNLNSV